MDYVYLLRSVQLPDNIYVGHTTDVLQRINAHNEGASVHTAKYRPWELVMYLSFVSEEKAQAFEKYLKTQSGRAFLRKRFV